MSEDKPVVPRQGVSSVVKGFSGSLGGVAEAVCLQPMDVIKTRLQLDTTGKYKGIIHCGRVSPSGEIRGSGAAQHQPRVCMSGPMWGVHADCQGRGRA